jgi:hypothetical protein
MDKKIVTEKRLRFFIESGIPKASLAVLGWIRHDPSVPYVLSVLS